MTRHDQAVAAFILLLLGTLAVLHLLNPRPPKPSRPAPRVPPGRPRLEQLHAEGWTTTNHGEW